MSSKKHNILHFIMYVCVVSAVEAAVINFTVTKKLMYIYDLFSSLTLI